MAKIFISYRRKDASGHAGRLFDRLSHWFKQDEIFFDRESIDGGEVFTERIDRAINAAEVVLVVIGPEWLNDENRERLHRPDDIVRGEIALALSLAQQDPGRKVIPVLCGEAEVSAQNALPENLQALPDRLRRRL